MTRPVLLLVDDEERILRSLSLLLRNRYDVVTTVDAREALAIVGAGNVHVIVSDQRMPVMTGVDLLREVRRRSPRTMRILLTGFADLQAVEGSLNDGEIFRYLEKPWCAERLKDVIAQAAAIAVSEFAAPTASPAAATVDMARVLVLDEDASTAALVRGMLPPHFIVNHVADVESALARLGAAEHAVVLAELRHSRDDVIGTLKWLKRESPQTMAIACSNLRDARILIDLINQGQVFRFLPKPLGRELLRRALTAALSRRIELAAAPIRVLRHSVDTPRQDLPLPARLVDYFRRIRENARSAAGRAG
jgi:DNA-binding NtrC family response regulator